MATQDPVNTTSPSFIKNRRSSLIAAIFLMATSAIGPGLLRKQLPLQRRWEQPLHLGY